MDHRIEVIQLPSGKFTWRYVKIYDTLTDLENEVKDMFNKIGCKEIEIGGKIFDL